MNKRLLTGAVCLGLCLSLCACGGGDTLSDATTTQPGATGRSAESGTETPQSETTIVATPLPVTAQKPVLQNGETYTGLPALPLQNFIVSDPENTKGLSTEKHGYGYGVAKNGQPHSISVGNQQYFETNGYKAVCLDQKTTDEKVLYLTFDCGYENGYTEQILDVLKEKNVPSAFFCTLPQVKDYPELDRKSVV